MKVRMENICLFFDTSDYVEDEINQSDVQFLIWYFVNNIQNDLFISPYSDFIELFGRGVFELLDKAWDYAPENNILKSYYTIDDNEKDYYIARQLINRILLQSYLFYPDTSIDFIDQEITIIEENGMDQHLQEFLMENRDLFLHESHTKLLAFSGKEWAAELIGESHPIFPAFKDMSPRIWGYFFYKGQDDQYTEIEHVASGKRFSITKKSFDY